MPSSSIKKFQRKVLTTDIYGTTPVKTRFFNRNDMPSEILPVSPSAIHSYKPDRPKTSRGIANPSPERFTDYVVSPERNSNESPVRTNIPNSTNNTTLFAAFLIGIVL